MEVSQTQKKTGSSTEFFYLNPSLKCSYYAFKAVEQVNINNIKKRE